MKYLTFKTCTLFILLVLISCSSADSVAQEDNEPEEVMEDFDMAMISGVSYSGEAESFTFSVEITSPDKGCNQYANWWEILSPDGNLIYRRVLGHSHVTEQPFTRSGGPVSITENQEVLVRVHMNNTGYSTLGYKGSIADGFKVESIAEGFADELKFVDPLPDGCAF